MSLQSIRHRKGTTIYIVDRGRLYAATLQAITLGRRGTQAVVTEPELLHSVTRHHGWGGLCQRGPLNCDGADAGNRQRFRVSTAKCHATKDGALQQLSNEVQQIIRDWEAELVRVELATGRLTDA